VVTYIWTDGQAGLYLCTPKMLFAGVY